ncbi:MAG: hypothetical protein AAF251_01590 [Pseudomonadota bacterium]
MSQLPIPEWAATVDDAQFTDPAKVKARAAKFERTIRRRNVIEYAAGALCIAGFAYGGVFAALEAEYLMAFALAFCIGCILLVLWQLNARGSYLLAPPEETCLQHLRGQYVRQYHALRSVPVWYLGPIALGLSAVYAAMILRFAQMGGLAKALEGTWQPIAGTALLFGFIWWLNWFAAEKLKKQIDQIDALR